MVPPNIHTVQTNASDEKKQEIDNEAYRPTVGMMIRFLLSQQSIPKVVNQVNYYRQSCQQTARVVANKKIR